MHLFSLCFLCVAAAASGLRRLDGMRSDGAPVYLPPGPVVELELAVPRIGDFPFKPFSDAYVAEAKSTPTNWVSKGAVTPAKDQGATGACGTFGRVAAAEGQFATHGYPLSNFSEAELYECVGWDQVPQQFSFFAANGFMPSEVYPYNTSAPSAHGDVDPPIPGRPCRFNESRIVPGSGGGTFGNATGAAPSEDQLTAFVYHNGPTQTGIYAPIFGLREPGCEARGDCFITRAMCDSVKGKSIDHSITLVGYGTDPKNGDFWLVKNSWSTAFANEGFIYVARGIGCGGIDCCGNLFTIGDPARYYE